MSYRGILPEARRTSEVDVFSRLRLYTVHDQKSSQSMSSQKKKNMETADLRCRDEIQMLSV